MKTKFSLSSLSVIILLAGSIDYRRLAPPPRWVGGVEIGTGRPDWRWDDAKADAVLPN